MCWALWGMKHTPNILSSELRPELLTAACLVTKTPEPGPCEPSSRDRIRSPSCPQRSPEARGKRSVPGKGPESVNELNIMIHVQDGLFFFHTVYATSIHLHPLWDLRRDAAPMGNISCVSTKDAEKDKVNSVASFSYNTFWNLLYGLVCFLFLFLFLFLFFVCCWVFVFVFVLSSGVFTVWFTSSQASRLLQCNIIMLASASGRHKCIEAEDHLALT